MRKPSYTTQFERDLRLLERRGKDIAKLKEVLTTLISAEPYGSPLWAALAWGRVVTLSGPNTASGLRLCR